MIGRVAQPYVGIQPFAETDRDYFFGRDKDRRIVVANLLMAPLTVLYGASGVGKSSLFNAGVTPDLRGQPRTAVVAFRRWSSAEFFAELKAACIGSGDLAVDAALPLDDLLAAIGSAVNGTVLVILDQFEEYLLYHTGEECAAFESQLAQAINREDVNANFLIGLREDCLSQLDRFRKRIPHLLRHTIHLKHLDAAGAEQAIRGPLAVYNQRVEPGARVQIEDGLVSEVVRQAQGEAAGSSSRGQGLPAHQPEGIRTPLLQLMMTSVWEEETKAGSALLRRATLDKLGGAQKIFTRHLDSVMNALDKQDRDLAARAFDYLVTPTGSKIAQKTEDLVLLTKARPDVVSRLLKELSDKRILCRIEMPERYEIFHDVLAPAILDWRLRYEKRRQTRKNRRLALITLALALYFLGTATAVLVNAIKARHARAEQMHSLASGLTLASFQNQSEDPELALILALHALRIEYSQDAETALKRAVLLSRVRVALTGHGGAVNRVAVSPDGSRFATASSDRTVKLWDREGHILLSLAGHRGAVIDAAFSADGKTLATGSDDATIGIWDVSSGRNLRMLANEDGAVTAVAFSPVDPVLASGSQSGAIRIRDARSGATVAVCRGHADRVRALVFNRDGSRLASAGSDRWLRLWEAHTGRQVAAGADVGEIWSVDFSPDGKRLLTSGVDAGLKLWRIGPTLTSALLPGPTAVNLDLVAASAFDARGDRIAAGGWDNVARVLDAQSGKELFALRGHTAPITSLKFDAQRLVTSSQDGTARIWDVATEPGSLTLAGDGHALLGVAFQPHGELIAAAGEEGTVHLWDTRLGVRQPEIQRERRTPVTRLAFSPDGQRLAIASTDGTAEIRDLHTAKASFPAWTHQDAVVDVAFSVDGRLLATASWDGTAAVLDASSGSPVAILPAHEGGVSGVAFSPDSKRLATAGLDGSAKLWDIASGRTLATFDGGGSRLFGVAFSPDGRRIAAAGNDGILRVWDAGTGALAHKIPAHHNWVQSVAFSPDGSLLMTAAQDGAVKLWSAASGKHMVTFFDNGGKVYQAVFSPDGARFATAAKDGILRVHGLKLNDTLESVIALARSRVTRAMTGPECQQYLGNEGCPDVRRPEVTIPDVDSRQQSHGR